MEPEDYPLEDGGCSCHCGNPPCSYCTDSTNCESCNVRFMILPGLEDEENLLCDSCYEDRENPDNPCGDELSYADMMSGRVK